MFVKQVSIFVENKKGTIADTILLLGENGINIRALSVADTSDYGILRLIVSEPEKAQEILKKNTNFESNYFEEIVTSENINIYTVEEIIRKLELLNVYQERFNYNVNMDLQYTSLFSKL